MKGKTKLFGLGLLMTGLLIGIGISIRLDIFSLAHSQSIKQDTPAATSLEGFNMEDAVIKVANTTGRAVVSISTERTAKIRGRSPRRYFFSSPPGGESPFGEDEFFGRFFDDFFGEMPESELKQRGLGSGVIINQEGYILTNEHVISDADKITVTLPDGREFIGEVKGKDARADLAIIKINAHNLPVASLGDSDNIKIGQWVVAIGNPFGFALQNPEPTVTVGVVSALHRSLGVGLTYEKDYNDLIQTDAAINPGNSGGPMVNLKGEIVGINVAIFSTSGGYQGVGFAIPINSAKRIVSQLIEGKKIMYGWLGVTVQNLTPELVGYFGLVGKNGVLVAKVLENSPAKIAGMKESDVITQFNNKPLSSVKELISEVSKTEVGRKVKVVVVRDKKNLNLEVQIGERPENPQESQPPPAQAGTTWRGLAVRDTQQSNRRQFSTIEEKGVIVVNVEPNSPAEEAGIMPGEVILDINRQPITNMTDYDLVTKGLKTDALVRTSRGYFLIKGE